jgi:hypothetical protein
MVEEWSNPCSTRIPKVIPTGSPTTVSLKQSPRYDGYDESTNRTPNVIRISFTELTRTRRLHGLTPGFELAY